MNRRSTSAEYTHYGGDVTAQVNSSHGVRLSGGSTGGIVEAVGDDTNVGLRLRAQGAGPILIGAAAQPVTFNSTSVTYSSGTVMQVGSTAPFAGFVRQISTAIATPDFTSTGDMGIISTVTLVGVNSSHIIVANPINLSSAVHITRAWAGSTNGSINLHWTKQSTVAIAVSTATIRFAVIRF